MSQKELLQETQLRMSETGSVVHAARWIPGCCRAAIPYWFTSCGCVIYPRFAREGAESDLPLCGRCRVSLERDLAIICREKVDAQEEVKEWAALYARFGAMLRASEVPPREELGVR